MKLKLILTAVLAATAFGAQAQTAPVKIKVAHFLPSISNLQRDVLEPWCETLRTESGGRLQCELYPAMAIGGTPPNLVSHVRDGIADVVWTSPSYTPNLFPAMEAIELPFVVPADGLGGSRAMWAYYEQHARKDFERYKVLALHSGSGQNLNTVKAPVRTLADMKGVKLRSPSRVSSRLLSALGAAPVNMPASAITESVSRGVADGALAPWELVTAIKLDEIARFHTEPPAGKPAYFAVSMALLMNKKKYEGLPAELKAVIDRNSGLPLVEKFGASWDRATEVSRKRAAALGNTLVIQKAEDYEAMRKAAESVEAEWIKEVKAKGLDGAALIAAAREISNKHLARAD